MIWIKKNRRRAPSEPVPQRRIISLHKELRTVRYTKGLDFTGDAVCTIDLMELRNEEMVVMIPGCRHLFHYACINGWLNSVGSRKRCPNCNANLAGFVIIAD